jgi:hypothetical protein
LDFSREQILSTLGSEEFETPSETGPPMTSPYNSGFSGFTSLMRSLLQNVMPEVTYTSAWPQGTQVKETVPAITYKVISRIPSKNIKPTIRQSLPDPDFPGHTVDVYGQFFDVVVEFSVWSDRSYEADGIGCTRDPASCPLLAGVQSGLCNSELKPEICPFSIDGLLSRFEEFMEDYSGVFMEKAGVQHLYFMEQGEDNKDTEGITPPLMKRSLRYFMKVEKIRVYKIADLEDITIKVDVPDQLKEE